MPLENQSGNTFVAFIDISGFKSLMKDNKGIKAINNFYSKGYECLQEIRELQGLFISDCGIIFTRNVHSTEVQFTELLKCIKKLNKLMLKSDLMLTISISYGDFSYNNKIEFLGIQKNPIYRNAYLSAFLDNENGKPKIEPGMCRIVKNKLPIEIANFIKEDSHFKFEETSNHFIYYWMCERNSIDNFKKAYNDSYNMKYREMLYALKGAVKNNNLSDSISHNNMLTQGS